MYVYHIFFISSSVDGYLGCFHLLAIVNSATMEIEVCISFQISGLLFFLDIYPGVEFLDHMVVVFLIF